MEDAKELTFDIDMDLDEDTFPEVLGISVERAKEIGKLVYEGRKSGEYKSHPELLQGLLKECNSYAETIFASYAVGNLMGLETGMGHHGGIDLSSFGGPDV